MTISLSSLRSLLLAPVMLLSSGVLAQEAVTIPVDSLEPSTTIDIDAFTVNAINAASLLTITAGDGSENRLDLDQDGLDNTALIDQSGDLNRVGTEETPGLQDGNNNTLVIEQKGDGNAVGTGPAGLIQRADDNVLRIGQTGVGSSAESVLQDSGAGVGAGANVAIVLQSDDGTGTGARLVALSQRKTAEGASNLVTVVQGTGSTIGGDNALITRDGGLLQSGVANVATVEQVNGANGLFALYQSGTANVAGLRQDGEANRVVFIDQLGEGNRATTIVSGSRNAVESIRQDNTLSDTENLIVLSVSGNDNGAGIDGELGTYPTDSAAAAAGVAQGALTQIGGGNQIDMAISGNESRYGVSQLGDDIFASIVIEENENGVAIKQFGDGSDATVLAVGTLNDIGIRQESGTTGPADGRAFATVRGNRNRVDMQQDGQGNTATATVEGSDNRLSITEDGIGNGTADLFGPAATVAAATGLTRGTAIQDGDRNALSLDIIGTLNSFAMRQDDDDNRIFGFIDGSGNAASVSQAGVQNVTMFSQRGSANSLGVRQ